MNNPINLKLVRMKPIKITIAMIMMIKRNNKKQKLLLRLPLKLKRRD
jgi:hypothetical protein